jgi:ATP-binding protein involved in chromosome partitioning
LSYKLSRVFNLRTHFRVLRVLIYSPKHSHFGGKGNEIMFFKKKPPSKDRVAQILAAHAAQSYVASVVVQDDGTVIVTLNVPQDKAHNFEALRIKIENDLKALKGVSKAWVVLTAEKKPSETVPPVSKKSAQVSLPNVRFIIAVGSGKGGVGKSTVAANIAVALSRLGWSVGLMDADIYGPSVPTLMGVTYQKPQQDHNGNLIPFDAHGVKIMSLGFLVDPATPMIWRGPMVQSAILQLLRDVVWGDLDCLVIDMPPGTGDAQLTLAQKVPLSGAVIVSTPQDLALIDARKGLEMFRTVHVPILGVVENMSFYCCPSCGHRDDIFGTGGAEAAAKDMGVSFLGSIPLNGIIRSQSDSGQPVALRDDEVGGLYAKLAKCVKYGLEFGQSHKPPPRIIFDA